MKWRAGGIAAGADDFEDTEYDTDRFGCLNAVVVSPLSVGIQI
jgi:hypothetical protein